MVVGTTVVHASTNYIISDDATGGDAKLIGTWDPTTKTCTLTTDVYGTIQISKTTNKITGITLDGAGHSIIGDGTGTGVFTGEYEGNIIKNAVIKNFDNGIWLGDLGKSNAITGCSISNNNIGIYAIHNNNNNIKGNTIMSNSVGIKFQGGSNNNIEDNTVSNNGDGIRNNYGGEFYYNSISGNTISSNSGDGIYLEEAGQNTISSNTISSNGNGINEMWSCSNDDISKNIVSKCDVGISLGQMGSVSNVKVSDNLIQENQVGIASRYGSVEGSMQDLVHNEIHNNCLGKNTVNAEGNGYNNFYSNYYSDYTGSDADSNGIGDTPYSSHFDPSS
jgi:parallel beta-helix repeat protein